MIPVLVLDPVWNYLGGQLWLPGMPYFGTARVPSLQALRSSPWGVSGGPPLSHSVTARGSELPDVILYPEMPEDCTGSRLVLEVR